MIVALIDNGSLEPAVHRNLRTVASALAARCGVHVHAVSWKHSDRIAPDDLGGAPAWALDPFIRAMVALGQREFVFVPFFISAQGAIGSALRRNLEELQGQLGGFEFTFTAGLAANDTIATIACERVRHVIATKSLRTPPLVVVDHGGPSAASARLRDQLAAALRHRLGAEVGRVVAASMEGRHPPLLADALRAPELAGRAAVIAPLFLAPGRHAGPDGDITRICRESAVDCHVAELIGTHTLALAALANALQHSLSLHPAYAFA